jgi:GxxExxY protein
MAPIKDVLTKAVIDVWSALGPGHSEAVYHAALKVELDFSIEVNRLSSGRCVPIMYKGHAVGRCELDLDFETDTGTMCILELKAIKGLRDDDRLQLLRYCRLFANVTTMAFLINFGSSVPEVEQVVSV